jgi:hypothetical protein
MDISINCEWENSTINPNLRICKHCNFVSSITEESANDRICPVLMDIAAHNPNYKQIRLNKISTFNADGSIVREQTMDQKNINNSAQFGDWWFGGVPENDIQHISRRQAEQMNQMRQLSTAPQEKPQVSNGKPCTQEQIDTRLEICKGCEFYKNNSCLKCGCSLSRDKNYMNKLYWADKSCPIGKWGPVE